jgi:hypothetical protein
MRRGALRRRAACIAGAVAGSILSAPGIASALSEVPVARDPAGWTPALAAWGARAPSPPPATGAAPRLGGGGAVAASSPALVSVGQGAAEATGDAAREYPATTRDETERWVPAFAFQSSMLGQNAEGSVDSKSSITYEYVVRQVDARPIQPASRIIVTRLLREGKVNFFSPRGGTPTELIAGNPFDPGPSAACPTCTGGLVLPRTGDNLLLTPTVGLSAELMTPGLQEAPGRPRLFFHNDASLGFSVTRSVGREGIPETVEFPPEALTPFPSEVEVKGVGSKTETEVKTLLVSGGMGVAFTLDAWDRRLRIKPSFEYMRETIKVSGRLTRAFRQDTGLSAQPVRNPNPPPAFILLPAISDVWLPPIQLESSDEITNYGIGPGLEVEMDTARAGPVMLSIFVSGQAYRMLGKRDLELEDTAEVQVPDDNASTPATQTVSAEWDFHKHAWSYRGGLGVRFRWLPEGR